MEVKPDDTQTGSGPSKKVAEEIAVATEAPPEEERIEIKEDDVLGLGDTAVPVVKRKRGRPRKVR